MSTAVVADIVALFSSEYLNTFPLRKDIKDHLVNSIDLFHTTRLTEMKRIFKYCFNFINAKIKALSNRSNATKDDLLSS